jgi:subtilase family serine protease
MRSLKLSPLFVLAGALLCSAGLLAQSSITSPRITSEIDESSLTTLKGHVPALARAEFDQGEADAATQLTHMRLVLSRSASQQAALVSYLAQLQDKSSPNYHKWLTPQQFGQLYGPADSDIAILVGWLQSHGFTVEPLSPGRTNIAFSGSVSQVEAAFHTAIHSYQTADAKFYSNTTDPQIPSALAGVVMGIAQLNTIRPRAHSVRGSVGRRNQQTGRAEPNSIPASRPSPMLTDGGDNLFIVPADAATIYDTPNPYNLNYAGTGCGSSAGCTGAGVKIGIGGEATIGTGSIVTTFRSTFLGASYATPPTIIPTGGNLATDSGDVDEAYIDNELSGGMAPGASIYYYPSADLTSGIDTAINANVVDIFSLSYGECEADNGTGENALINGYWEQAAGQGIAVAVSTGDSGSTSCDGDTARTTLVAKLGLSVSGFASTPYNIAVGGTDFYGLENSFSAYVNTSLGTAGAPTYYRTALSYIPESIWNDSTLQDDQPLAQNVPNGTGRNESIVAGSGGVSSCAIPSGSSCVGYPMPSWQAGPGIPAAVPSGVNASARSLPDVAIMSGNGYDYATWLICDTEEPCTSISGGIYDGYGGTSTAAPAFAGILALVQQKTVSRLGQAAQELYALYNGAHAASVFHDVTVGNNSVPCVSNSPNCADDSEGYYFETGYNADTGFGYNLAAGLGSVDATQLVNYWSSSTGSAAATIMVNASPNPATTAESVTVTISVSGSSGTPTGKVSVTSGAYGTGAQTLGVGTCTAANCPITIPAGALAVGADTLVVTYSGDTTYATTMNNSTIVTVTGTSSSATFVLNNPIPVVSPTTIAPGVTSAATITVSSTNGYAGTVTLTCALTSPTTLTDPPSCAVTKGSPVTLSSGTTSGTATVTVSTTAASSAALVYPKLPGKGRGLFGAGSGALLALLLFFGIPARRRSWRSMLGFLVLMAALGSLAACNSTQTASPPPNTGTSAGTYTFTVTGTGNPTVTPAPTVQFAVIVN